MCFTSGLLLYLYVLIDTESRLTVIQSVNDRKRKMLGSQTAGIINLIYEL